MLTYVFVAIENRAFCIFSWLVDCAIGKISYNLGLLFIRQPSAEPRSSLYQKIITKP